MRNDYAKVETPPMGTNFQRAAGDSDRHSREIAELYSRGNAHARVVSAHSRELDELRDRVVEFEKFISGFAQDLDALYDVLIEQDVPEVETTVESVTRYYRPDGELSGMTTLFTDGTSTSRVV